ncbi:hypothetical protein JOQ06_026533 [Pogonophryne albipinna]|uniref:Uncharacterized protein n=1 Tax=Pogonophryne albipinna TaxID=1090488 RepID=A0AAD6FNN8_9TELE|nr:hypothetical protein JOQ06_026533 [Pogonophryne albipinna]
MAHIEFTQQFDGETQAAGVSGGQDEEGTQRETPGTLPRFDALSTASDGSQDVVRIKVRIARLEIEAKERAGQAQPKFQLEIRKLELDAQTHAPAPPAGTRTTDPCKGKNEWGHVS